MKYTGPAPPNFYSHWARLISPPVPLTTNSCLRITVVANANITILKSFLSVDGMYSERRLFASALPLGQAWHRLWISIAPSVANQKFAAVIETAISEGIVAMAVSDVSLAAGNCRLLGKRLLRWLTGSFIRWLFGSFFGSLVHSLVGSLVHSFFRQFVHELVLRLIR